MFDRLIKRRLLKSLTKTAYGSLTIELPDGKILCFKGKEPGLDADIKLFDLRVVANVMIKGDVGFAEDYRDGYWNTNDLENLISFGLQNDELFSQYGNGGIIFKQLSNIFYLTKRNNLKGSKKNIQAHYDLGNDFYKLWLDPSMTYSSAMFTYPEQCLTEAQHQKYDRLISKFTKPNANVLEIGCGWGGFAERAIEKGHSVKCITLSNQQALYAKDRLPQPNVVVEIEDYRKQKGKYDYIVSIEMLEAVGQKFWPVYFNKLKELLKPGGKILLQTITIADDVFKQYTKNADMIRTFIFPGGMLPSERELDRQFKKTGLICNDICRFGQDYALTLRHWLKAFDNAYQEVKKLGFDDEFIRLWRFYLAACSAGFDASRINVVQMELTHA